MASFATLGLSPLVSIYLDFIFVSVVRRFSTSVPLGALVSLVSFSLFRFVSLLLYVLSRSLLPPSSHLYVEKA